MTKILLVAGCSHSNGSEITAPGSHRDPNDLERCFGNKIAQRNNMTMVNIAYAGASNKLIESSIVKNLNKLISEGHKSEDIIVLIGWTSHPREYVVENGKYYGFTLNQHNMSSWKRFATLNLRKFYKVWLRFVNYELLSIEHVIRHLTITGYLKNKGIKYYAFNAVDRIVPPANEFDPINFFNNYKIDEVGYNEIEKDIYYRKPFSYNDSYFQTLMLDYKLDPTDNNRWYHYAENGHEIWATILEKEMKLLGLL